MQQPPSPERLSPTSEGVNKTQREMELQEKKARLYDLKNKLLKYESFEELPPEELESLCEGIQFEHNSNASNSEDEMELEPPSQPEIPRHIIDVVSVDNECFRSAYMVKLKQVMVIFLVILCIVVRSNLPSSPSYDMGDFSIYQTRYKRNLFQTHHQTPQKDSKLRAIEQWMGMDEPELNVKLYLPKTLEKVKKKEQREIKYEDCIISYSQVCIDRRLSLYGSMNLELEDWMMSHLTGSEQVAFEASINYTLSIVLSALKVKLLFSKGQPAGRVTIIDSSSLGFVEMNSIKLSLIENECQDFVEILKTEEVTSDKLSVFLYVVTSQEFYVQYIFPFAQALPEKYAKTNLLVFMPRGVSNITAKLLKEEASKHKIVQIKFSPTNDLFFAQQALSEAELAFDSAPKFSMILIESSSNSPITIHSQTSKQSQVSTTVAPNNAENTKPQQNSKAVANPSRSNSDILVLDQHPCINQNSYGILPIMSFFDKFAYIDTVTGDKLLVSQFRAEQYKQKGAISPELLFFISQNIKPTDVLLFAYDLYRDDLILLTAAKTLSNQERFYCLTADPNHPVLTENLRMNAALNLVSYVNINVEGEAQMHELYGQRSFTVLFTSFPFLSRDYNFIFNKDKPKLVIFFWIVDVMYIDFVKMLAREHRLWAILQKFEKTNFENKCSDYGLMEVREERVTQMDKSWMVVQM